MKPALKFVILLGIVSLFADVTYEGARSITGPFLAILGAGGAVVGIVAGFGEFAGYGIRLISGFITDKTKLYWPIAFVGYTINLLAVPLLAFAGNWQVAALLIIIERVGKAIRVPPRDAMLSYATKEMGRGWGFGIHEALDSVGACVGPLVITLSLYIEKSYRVGFGILAIPAVITLFMLVKAKKAAPEPQTWEPPHLETKGFSKAFWLYLAAAGCVAAGYVDFALIAYHFQKGNILDPVWIPLFYAFAMAIAGLGALGMGKLFDRKGMIVLIAGSAAASIFTPFVFFGGFKLSLIGMLLWGLGMGCQGSVFRGMVAHLVPPEKRAAAYGIFGLWFGFTWFAGSAIMGLLYDRSILTLVIFSMALQLGSIPLFIRSRDSTVQ